MFSSRFDRRSSRGGAYQGMFGTGVLNGLIEGIDEYRAGLERQPYRSRSLGPAMLGAFHRLDDEELVQRIAGYPAACVVVRREPQADRAHVEQLREAAKRGAGFPAGALPGLPELVLAAEGHARVAGPTSPMEDVRLGALRTVGSGADEDGAAGPAALHTRMVLLGELWWHDETTLSHATDVAEFTPHRLWLGSANGTARSRTNLEFGLWLDDRALLETAQQFLVQLLAQSRDWDPDEAAARPAEADGGAGPDDGGRGTGGNRPEEPDAAAPDAAGPSLGDAAAG